MNDNGIDRWDEHFFFKKNDITHFFWIKDVFTLVEQSLSLRRLFLHLTIKFFIMYISTVSSPMYPNKWMLLH